MPIESIAEDHYGMLVVERHSLDEYGTVADTHVSGVLLEASGRILVDALEAARAPGRRRFTIAHELGHLALPIKLCDRESGRPSGVLHPLAELPPANRLRSDIRQGSGRRISSPRPS